MERDVVGRLRQISRVLTRTLEIIDQAKRKKADARPVKRDRRKKRG
jgi:hypothetical protein